MTRQGPQRSRYGRQIHLAHGVIGGLDVVETAAMMGEVTAGLTKRKFSRALPGATRRWMPWPDRVSRNSGRSDGAVSGSIECGNFSRFSRRKSGEDRDSCFSSRDGRLHYKVRGYSARQPFIRDWEIRVRIWRRGGALAMLRRLTSPIVF